MNKNDLTEAQIRLTAIRRSFVIDRFSQIEEEMSYCIYVYYRKMDMTTFTEDIFMSGKDGFGLKMDLYRKIILDRKILSADDCKVLSKALWDMSKIRNYFAHTNLLNQEEKNGKFLFRKEKSLEIGRDLDSCSEEFRKHNGIYSKFEDRIINFIKENL